MLARTSTATVEPTAAPTSADPRLAGKQFVTHAALSTTTICVAASAAFLISVLIGRLLGERPIGQYGYAQAFSAIVLSLFGLGLPSYLILSVARADDTWPHISKEVIGLFTTVCAPLAISVVLTAWLLNPTLLGPAAVMVPATVSVFALSLTGMIQACLQAIGDFGAGLRTALLTRALAVLAILMVDLPGHGIASYLLALAGVHATIAALLARYLSRTSSGLVSWTFASWPAHIRAAAPFGALVLLRTSHEPVRQLGELGHG